MRICYLANANGVHNQRWIDYFVRCGHEVHMISFEKPTRVILGVQVHYIPTRKSLIIPFTFFLKVIQFRRIIKQIQPDIIHAHYISKYGILAPFMNFRPYVLSAWGNDVLIDVHEGPLRHIRKFFVSYSIANADGIHAGGKTTCDAMIALGAPAEKIVIANFGIKADIYNPKRRSNKIHRILNPGNGLVIVSTRHLQPIYDVETIIKAARMVLNKASNVMFVIIGDGYQKEYLKSLAEELEINEHVQFIGSVVSHEIPQYLASCDIYVSTALSDNGLAASTGEAMASQIPVIVTDVCDNKQWILDGENGFVIKPRCPSELAEKIMLLIDNPDLRTKFGKNGRKIIVEKDNYDKEMAKVDALYKKLVDE